MGHRFIGFIVARDGASSSASTGHTMMDLLIVLLSLLLTALVVAGALIFMRRRRRARKVQELPMYEEKHLSIASSASNHRRTMIRPSELVQVHNEKHALAKEMDSPPDSPLPEIRVTFPEEYDASGKRTSGRVVVVHISESGVGLERAETLPAYQQTEGERFQSLDLDRIGGLVEKARNPPKAFD